MNDGGLAPVLPLLRGSPAIGAGITASGVSTDQRGLPRPAIPDIGAFQSQPVVALGVSAPSTVIAGTAFNVTLTALDSYGNAVTNYNGTATLTSTDAQAVFLSAARIALRDGTATMAVTLNTPNAVKLVALAGTIQGVSGSIAVNPMVASFGVWAPSQATAGSAFSVTVQALDPFGRVVANYNGSVVLTSSDGQTVSLGFAATLSGGTGTYMVTLNTANTVALTASAGNVRGTSGSVQVSPNQAASLVLNVPGSAATGVPFGVTLTAKDAYGNVATGYDGAVTFSSSGGQTVTRVAGHSVLEQRCGVSHAHAQ
jgi:hypothetical protein